ncbi:Transcriptional regulatory protein ZraR [Posidoniimonas polymericola]|uniref:Transcriptional regulatory protein ZraR n=1 Tax=Posidoniimonas polymericola TaxID=2528002 RepID=A0A5C5YU60_9BACT|nr:sigma 54-interacting transcriptional regulator [Posidoniimonas polymericola]TWT78306.1 Transcriptional regulatory protein ZraR [Posidoniimonas polymericola]
MAHNVTQLPRHMPLITPHEAELLRPLSRLAYCNPFLPERLELEQAALGGEYEPEEHVAWSRTAASHYERPNVVRLTALADRLATKLRAKLATGVTATAEELRLYDDLVVYVLYYRWIATLSPAGVSGHKAAVGPAWESFRHAHQHFHEVAGLPTGDDAAAHLFACLHQVRRAFRGIFDCILGDSLPAARLRAQVWQSIFTHDMRRYRRSLYSQMGDFSTLITGPSGTGKELVARAIALSQFIAVDPQTGRLCSKPDLGFVAINLSALSPTLVESELFGHCRGAYTGAVGDRTGWLETCPEHGAVFLDEIGELDPAIQVKLLRVVQSRSFCRLGETTERPFKGKVIAATNRDLAAEMQAGRFREDLYYRLCSDRIETPSLREQVDDRPEALGGLILLLCERVAGDEAPGLAVEVQRWIEQRLPTDYPWQGNIRELEQCVRNVLVRQEYAPRTVDQPSAQRLPGWLAGADEHKLSADDLLRRFCTSVYARLDNYEHAAKQLGLDRRTVRSKIDSSLLAELRHKEEPLKPS